MQWNNQQPIYLQLKSLITDQILDGIIKEGDAIPSIRALSQDFSVNHLTVAKAINPLVDAGILEKRRGLGMFVKKDAVKQLQHNLKQEFLSCDWPRIAKKLRQLNISLEELIHESRD